MLRQNQMPHSTAYQQGSRSVAIAERFSLTNTGAELDRVVWSVKEGMGTRLLPVRNH